MAKAREAAAGGGGFVRPRVYLIGYTGIDFHGLLSYLEDTDQREFYEEAERSLRAGVSEGEVMTSFYAKLCYASLTDKHNRNIDRVRDVPGNLRSTFDQAHLSVWEHASVNFVATDVSRVYTHEMVRHRAGTAFSQTSGRYVRRDRLDMITDPILAETGVLTEEEQEGARVWLERLMLTAGARLEALGLDQTRKKQATSALRRFLPNGQANEIGITLNLRAIRHTVMMRTSRSAEREIREVFGQVYRLLRTKFPLLFYQAVEEEVGGLVEVSGMRMQPYEAAPVLRAGKTIRPGDFGPDPSLPPPVRPDGGGRGA